MKQNPAYLLAAIFPMVATLTGAADEPAIKSQPVNVAWQYSVDGGKSFTDVRPDKAQALMARGTFNVEDPDKVAGLWIAHIDPEIPSPVTGRKLRSGFAMAGHLEARNKTCGASPLWTYTKVEVNGKPVTGPQEAMVYIALPIEPAGLLVKGVNTLTVTGTLWSADTKMGPCPLKPLQLIAAEPQPSPILGGPLLGMGGPDFATITCSTLIPAAVTVTAKPVEPAGTAVSAVSKTGIYHIVKMPLPAGTKKFSYTVTSSVGRHESSVGPFTARLPPADGRGFKFAAMGNTRCHKYTVETGPKLADKIAKTAPDLFVHVGQVVELATWDAYWEPYFFDQYRPLISSMPVYLSPDGGDHVGRLYRAFGTPAGDDKPLNWTQAFGDTRLIGCDGAYEWTADSENTRWLESVLKVAQEKYIFVFNHFPGYTDGYQSSPPSGVTERNFKPIKQCREVILPMLGKYRATALISAYDYNYERLEPTPDKGVTCIIVGAGGAKTYCQGAANPFTSTAKWIRAYSFALFEVKENSCEMSAISIDGATIDSKTFKPRQ